MPELRFDAITSRAQLPTRSHGRQTFFDDEAHSARVDDERTQPGPRPACVCCRRRVGSLGSTARPKPERIKE
jgi:hypothetical protein